MTPVENLPPWARAATIVGIPGVIALYLVYMLANAIPAKLEAHAMESRANNSMQVQLLQRICSNTSDTPEERAACWSLR